MRSVTRLAQGIALAASLTGCGSSDAEMFAAVSQATETALPAAFAELKFEHQSPSTSPTPALVFEGKHAVMLSVSEPALRGTFFKEVHLDVLARSQGGRFFTVSYVSELKSPNKLSFMEDASCIEAECRHLSGARMLSQEEAKSWFFHDKKFTPERFKEIFGEAPPPQKIPA